MKRPSIQLDVAEVNLKYLLLYCCLSDGHFLKWNALIINNEQLRECTRRNKICVFERRRECVCFAVVVVVICFFSLCCPKHTRVERTNERWRQRATEWGRKGKKSPPKEQKMNEIQCEKWYIFWPWQIITIESDKSVGENEWRCAMMIMPYKLNVCYSPTIFMHFERNAFFLLNFIRFFFHK